MPDIATAFTHAQLVSAQRSLETATRRGKLTTSGLMPSDMDARTIGDRRQVHCYDQWLIARAEPNRERRARESLMREGFECWYPAGRKVTRLPQRFVSSKTRHKKRHVLLEDVRTPYPGYLFVRRLTSLLPLADLWHLNGVVGVCAFGDQYATIEDYRIDLMRIHEDSGFYDQWRIDGLTNREYQLAEVRQTEAAKERWSSKPRTLGQLDKNHRAGIHLVEEFGRITRVIAQPGDPAVPAA